MIKFVSILMTLCLLCSAAAAFAGAVEEKIPELIELPDAKTLDPDADIEESDYEGEWVLKYAYIGTEPASVEQVAEKGMIIRPLIIRDGSLIDITTDENGNEKENAMPYEFEEDVGQLVCSTEDGKIEYVVDLLEDDNIMLSIMLFGGDEPVFISLYMVHPEA